MKLADGNYFSPDFGYFTVKDNIAYDDLHVTDLSNAIIRYMEDDHTIDFSLITNEQREANLKAFKEGQDKRQAAEEARQLHIEQIVQHAKTKLTTEEFDAIVEHIRRNDL